ncbi:MAG: hypothetical protein CME31_16970 [Gimesia sp.]|uniref:Uncharacterized protein n=1 Tax=Gimesia maris TaxID=122 RepID=A0A3D3R5R9_9PLAN|nr:hypothetical protein [Gimesia sp.]HCO24204.1 hypothetical protein [Gimesia maris]
MRLSLREHYQSPSAQMPALLRSLIGRTSPPARYQLALSQRRVLFRTIKLIDPLVVLITVCEHAPGLRTTCA